MGNHKNHKAAKVYAKQGLAEEKLYRDEIDLSDQLAKRFDQNKCCFGSVDECAHAMRLSPDAVRELRNYGAPFWKGKTRPDILIRWIEKNAGKPSI